MMAENMSSVTKFEYSLKDAINFGCHDELNILARLITLKNILVAIFPVSLCRYRDGRSVF